MLKDEYDILKELNHENVIKIYRLINFENFLMISMKLTKENLSDFANRRRKSGNPLSEEECAQIMTGIFRGVAYLHSEKDIIHRDLKPPNIVVSSYNDLTKCKIIDFGIATHNKKENLRKYGNIGTLVYQPPEQVSNKFNYGKMSDIWALGIIAYTLLTGKHPFVKNEDATDEIKDKIMKFKEMRFPSSVSEQAKHFISKLCTHEQSHRYSSSEALQHPWITRQLSATPPLTKQEKQNYLGEQLMIEDKLRRMQSVLFFLSVNKLNHAQQLNSRNNSGGNNNPYKSLIDVKYMYKLRTQDNTVEGSTPSKKQKSSLQRRITVPKIDVQKTSSLAQREQDRAIKLLQKQHQNIKGIKEEIHEYGDELRPSGGSNSNKVSSYSQNPGNSTHDQINFDLRNQEGLSPDSNFNQNARKSTINENSQLLMVPDKRRKKTLSSGSGHHGHSASGDNRSASLSPSSPMELRMNISGNFSDFMSSDDENSQKDQGVGSSSSLIKSQKMKKAITSTAASQQKRQFIMSQAHRLPEIEENKSIQAKNSQPKDVLSKIKNQRVEVKDIKSASNRYTLVNQQFQSQSSQYQELKSVQYQNHISSQNQKRKLSKPATFHETLDAQNSQQKPGSLIQMMHEQIKDEEEKKRAFGKSQVKQKSFKPGLNHMNNNNPFNQQRASSSYGHYPLINNDLQGSNIAGGVVNIEFLPLTNSNNLNQRSSNPIKPIPVPSPQRGQINMFKRMQ